MTEWISVDDRLPEENEYVNVAWWHPHPERRKVQQVDTQYFLRGEWYQPGEPHSFWGYITHWQPLPNPPPD